jgi:hypothetical protein
MNEVNESEEKGRIEQLVPCIRNTRKTPMATIGIEAGILSQASAVRTNIGEIAERSPSEVVHLPTTVSSHIKYKIGISNRLADYLSRPPVASLNTVLHSCGHETLEWPQLYQQDPDFVTTYQLLGTCAIVTYFHIQDELYAT